MSRLKGLVAAGLQILSTKPALVMKHRQECALIVMGIVALSIAAHSLVGASGSSVPVPVRKPDMAAHNLNTQVNVRNSAIDSSEDVYKSPMNGTQMDLYRDIFRLQANGAIKDADTLIMRLKDRSLMGHVMAQRYIHTTYKVSYQELRDWLSAYADHPEAARIAKLANARRPSGQAGTLTKVSYAPVSIEELEEQNMAAKTYQPNIKRTAAQNDDAKALVRAVRNQIQDYEPSSALRLFNESKVTPYLDSVEKDRIRAMISAGYLYAGKTDEAQRLSAQALNGSHAYAPQAGWVHGLTKWRQGLYGQAASSFEIAAGSPYATGWMAAASAYWAARAHQKAGHNFRANQWLEKASHYPKTFYGLLANQSLGKNVALNWDAPQLTRSQEQAILSTPAGLRAEKLLAAGEVTLAEAEIRSLYVRGDEDRKKALLAYAYSRKLPSLTLKLGHAMDTEDANDAALYPSMPWSPNQGFRIDRALLHAIIRQESRFNALAENKGSGATGLMQIMPNTANHVSRTKLFVDREGRALLKTPEISLDIGQQYIEDLLNNSLVGQDLISLAIAYNAGPGTLARWKAERGDINDPLLFIETIPYAETRNYVQRVLTNYWIYRMRFDQDNDSMVALSQGRWARYAALDKGAVKFASK